MTGRRAIFGSNLRRFRNRKGLTQEGLAALSGCGQGYISSLEGGDFSPSMSILEKLAAALEISPAELLMAEADGAARGFRGEGLAIINERSRDEISAPTLESGKATGDSKRVFCAPGLRPSDAFAAYLPDDSMAPEFSKGDLVVFSLTREPADGDACLVDTGKGQVLLRTVLALPGGKWRLQPSSAKFAPTIIKAGRRVRMWPAVGRWQMLRRPHRR